MKEGIFFSSKSNEWSTPDDFYRLLDIEFGFKLDTASTDENAKCEKHFTLEDDSMVQNWQEAITDGNIWCNPPYGRQIGHWIKKAYNESFKGDAIIVMLIPAGTDTKIWHDYIFNYAAEIRFVKGRLKFGGHTNAAPFPSAVIIFDRKREPTIVTTMERS